MTWIHSIQSLLPLPRPERRSESQIENDLEHEIAFHIEQSEREFMEAGNDPDAARGLARARFGDVDEIKRRCKRIAMEERIMLQRVNFVLMLLVTLMVIGVGIQVMITQRYNTLALQAITTDITNMKYNTLADERKASAGAQQGVVYIDGDVTRPGVYQIPMVGTLTLRRLIVASGGTANNSDARITVTQIGADGISRVKFKMERLKDEDSVDYVLSRDEHVHVELLTKGAESRRADGSANQGQSDEPRDGRWVQVDVHGNIVEGGWVLEMIGPTDLRYRPGVQGTERPIGFVALSDRELRLAFRYSNQLAISTRILQIDQQLAVGRWTWEGDLLALNVTDAIPEIAEPLKFKRMDVGTRDVADSKK